MELSSNDSEPSFPIVNRNAPPPGNHSGERNLTSPLPLSTVATILGVPPEEGIDSIPPPVSLTKRIFQSGPQVAPNRNPASHIVFGVGVPPASAIFFSLFACQNPSHSPSGEK